jgi:hypothetical protein
MTLRSTYIYLMVYPKTWLSMKVVKRPELALHRNRHGLMGWTEMICKSVGKGDLPFMIIDDNINSNSALLS